VREIGPREYIIREGDRPENVHVILEGFACRYKHLPDGGRQVMAYLVPGDACDLHIAILGEMDHAIGTLTACRVAYLPQKVIEDLTTERPAIARALWWATLVDEAILREWLVGMGRRAADKRLAHLLCELLIRLQAVGQATETSFDFPLTQAELADALGISTVHVNRMVQTLREDGLITLAGKHLEIPEPERLKAFAEFDPSYLHLNKRSRQAPDRAPGIASSSRHP
jgi:CRP-like cAMP-binding protein